jgi:hypothetical protein
VVIRGVLGGFFRVMLGMRVMAMRYVGMVVGLLMISRGVMLSGVAMVFRCVLVMLGGFQVVLFTFFRHGCLFLR